MPDWITSSISPKAGFGAGSESFRQLQAVTRDWLTLMAHTSTLHSTGVTQWLPASHLKSSSVGANTTVETASAGPKLLHWRGMPLKRAMPAYALTPEDTAGGPYHDTHGTNKLDVTPQTSAATARQLR